MMNEGVFKETWRGEYAMMPSLGGPVGAWLYQAILGIRPDPQGPGYERVIIKPEPVGGVSWAKGSYDSLRGTIRTNWKRSGDRFHLRVEIPVGTTATVHLPADAADSLHESGSPLEQSPGGRFLRWEDGRAVIAIDSGRYEFEGRISNR